MEIGQKNITSFLGKRERTRSDSESGSVEPPASEGKAEPTIKREDALSRVETDLDHQKNQWNCPRCTHHLDLDDPVYELLHQEHQDYHFALDLNQSDSAPVPAAVNKRAKKKKDIRAFFKPK